MFYRPYGKAVAADVIPYFHDGEFKLFYLKDFRDFINCGEGVPWCLLTTKDLVNYTDYGEVIERGTVDEQDLYVFTGSVFEHNGEFYIFYTGHNPRLRAKGLPEQKILLAKSKDMKNWEKQKDFEIAAPEWLEKHDFRDPFVYYDHEQNVFKMLLAARLKDGPSQRKGCTVAARSNDLINWTVDEEPFYAPDTYYTHECPDLFKMGDYYYLVFSEFSDKVVTRYRMSKSINGPWITPDEDTFDGHCFYAAKTASDGNKRYLFGWNCIRNHESDYECWQWGGTIIAHEVVQNKDGTLSVKCPDAVSEQYNTEITTNIGYRFGNVEVKGGKVTVGGDKHSAVLFNEMPQNCKITFDFVTQKVVRDFGILLRSDKEYNLCYLAKFEPRFNRLTFDRNIRPYGPIHHMVENERYCPVKPNEKHSVMIIVEGSVTEVYVDDKIAMSTRMDEYKSGAFGFYASDSIVEFSNIKLFK